MPKLPAEPYCEELPSYFNLGETKAEIKLSNVDDNRNAALALASQARFNINIFTQNMDDAIYNNDEFAEHIFNLATRHPSSQIRILVQDSTPAVKKGHRLIKLAQTLTSSVTVRNPPVIDRGDKCAFMTVDNVGILYRVNGDSKSYDASLNFMTPQRAAKLNEFFNNSWEHGAPDLQVRRLFV